MLLRRELYLLFIFSNNSLGGANVFLEDLFRHLCLTNLLSFKVVIHSPRRSFLALGRQTKLLSRCCSYSAMLPRLPLARSFR